MCIHLRVTQMSGYTAAALFPSFSCHSMTRRLPMPAVDRWRSARCVPLPLCQHPPVSSPRSQVCTSISNKQFDSTLNPIHCICLETKTELSAHLIIWAQNYICSSKFLNPRVVPVFGAMCIYSCQAVELSQDLHRGLVPYDTNNSALLMMFQMKQSDACGGMATICND